MMADDQSVQVLSVIVLFVAHMHADLFGPASAGLCSGWCVVYWA